MRLLVGPRIDIVSPRETSPKAAAGVADTGVFVPPVVWGLGFGVCGSGFGVWGLGFGVWGLGFGVWPKPKWPLTRHTAALQGYLALKKQRPPRNLH